jgi:Prokaryotic dksA/traR C4-type zinc finger
MGTKLAFCKPSFRLTVAGDPNHVSPLHVGDYWSWRARAVFLPPTVGSAFMAPSPSQEKKRMNRNLVAQARKQLLRRGRALLRAAQAGIGAPVRPDALGAMQDAELDELQEIHAALERIERGIFGRCDDCQAEIEEERLERVPWERTCSACRERSVPASESRASI